MSKYKTDDQIPVSALGHAKHEPAAATGTAAPSRGALGLEPWMDSPRQQEQNEQIAQLRAGSGATASTPAAPEHSGLPAGLRRGVEALSGMDMSGVRVHRNSSKPAALQAHAYTLGRDIHLGPGQEQHLPHEAWHVVQQRQSRVKPTTEIGGLAVNENPALEQEADRMGAHADQQGATAPRSTHAGVQLKSAGGPSSQLVHQYKKGGGQGGRGGHGKPQVAKRQKPDDERRRREAIGRHHERRCPIEPNRPRGQGGPRPEPQQQPQQAERPAPHRPDEERREPPVGVNNPQQDVRVDRAPELAHHPRRDVVIDIPEAPARDHADPEQRQPGGWSGVGRRIKRKATRGRTFGDTANMAGTVGGLLSDVSSITSGTMTAIGGAGVTVNGITLLLNGLRDRDRASNAGERREAAYGITAGLFNIASGVYGLEAGISALAKASELSTVSGLISTGAWALSEATNVVAQLDAILQARIADQPLRDYVKPIASLLASLLKCTGSAVALYAGIAKALGDENKDAGIAGNVLMLLGIAISVIHGIVKLVMICKKELRNPQGGPGNGPGDVPDQGPIDPAEMV